MSDDTKKNKSSADAEDTDRSRNLNSVDQGDVGADHQWQAAGFSRDGDTNSDSGNDWTRAEKHQLGTSATRGRPTSEVPLEVPRDIFDTPDDIPDEQPEIFAADVPARKPASDSLTPEVEQHLKEFFQIGMENNGLASPPSPPRTLLTNDLVESFDFGNILNDGLSDKIETESVWQDALDSSAPLDEPGTDDGKISMTATVPDPDFGNIDIEATVGEPLSSLPDQQKISDSGRNDVSASFETEEKTTASLPQDVLDEALNIAKSAISDVGDSACAETPTDTDDDCEKRPATSENEVPADLEDDIPGDDRPTLPSKRVVGDLLRNHASGAKDVEDAENEIEGAPGSTRRSQLGDAEKSDGVAQGARSQQKSARTPVEKIAGFALAAAALFIIGFMIFRGHDTSPMAPNKAPQLASQTSSVVVAGNDIDRVSPPPTDAPPTDDGTFFVAAPAPPVSATVSPGAEKPVDTTAALLSRLDIQQTRMHSFFNGVTLPHSTMEALDMMAEGQKSAPQAESVASPSTEGVEKAKANVTRATAGDQHPLGSQHLSDSRPRGNDSFASVVTTATGEAGASEETKGGVAPSPVMSAAEDVVFTASFKFGTAIFCFPSKAAQRAFVQAVRSKAKGKRILIRGYITQSEKDKRLGRVAISRAWAVHKFLQRRNFDPAIIQSRRGDLSVRESLPTNRNAVVTVSFVEPLDEPTEKQKNRKTVVKLTGD